MQRMQRYVERLVKLNVHFDEEMAIDIVLNSLPSCYDQFILAYLLNNNETTLAQLHNMMQTAEAGMKGKASGSTSASAPGLRESEEVEHGRINLIMGNKRSSLVTKIGVYILVLSSDVSIDLLNSLPCNGMYETVTCVDNLGNSVFNIDSSNGIDKACLWHCRLGHINKKCIAQLQKDGVLESFDLRDEDDYNRYGYIYLTKHKSETFEKFKEFKHQVENQLGRKIKMLRSDRGGEYLSIKFHDYLKECGIVSQLTPPMTPQLNGVAKRRNRTLLDMVRSIMSRASLPIHFWGYALETATHILNLVPTKVAKTPHEMWTGKVPSPSENMVFLARRGVFLERELIFNEDSGSTIELEEIQESINEGNLNDTSTQLEEEVHVEPINNSLPLRRSIRDSMPPEFYGFHIITDGDTFVSDRTLVNLDGPASYKEAVAGLEAAKWKEEIDSEIKSMYDNQVWNLVDNVPGRKTVG
ncbi:hypothetical protein L2E82_18275 [Cichorium intybus]|uniref:Uncharacterized protein n=1 Tax=Cichorium intybus TaxID=13427 RepID=A0ACB9FAZ0_CICIN|nr:hypothetical protein L2E82_18275 [Cichorium intybus]